MSSTGATRQQRTAATPVAANPVEVIDALRATVNALTHHGTDKELINQITALEKLKSSCAAAQAQLTHTFTLQHTTDSHTHKIPADRTRNSINAHIALARRESRHRGNQLVGIAHALTTDMPHTLAALAAGHTTERRAMLIITELACLTPTDRRTADTQIAASLPHLGDLTAHHTAAAIAYRLDPTAVMGKIRGAVTDRHVTLRPAPETMTRLSALLPVAQGVAIYAALHFATNTAISAGDPRTRGQLMADELTTRITGNHITGCDPYGIPTHTPTPHTPSTPSTSAPSTQPAPAAHTAHTGIQLSIIMTDRSLFGDDNEPAHLTNYGPIPAPLARALIRGNPDTTTTTWITRLYTDPTGTQLLATDSRQRLFPHNTRNFLIARDHTCRTPWCDAPIRHLDHLHPHHHGGPTTLTNGQGLCQACNHTKQTPGWKSTPTPNGTITTTTPTGHTYTSPPPWQPHSPPWEPQAPRWQPWQAPHSQVEHRIRRLLIDAA